MGNLKRLVEDTNSSIVINEFFDYICSVDSQDEFDAIESYVIEKIIDQGRTISQVTPKTSGGYKPVFGKKGKISRGSLKHNLGQVKKDVMGGINKFKAHTDDVFNPINKFLGSFIKKDDGNSRVQNVKNFFNDAKQKRQELSKDNRNINDAPRLQRQTIVKKMPTGGWGINRNVYNPMDTNSENYPKPKQKTGFVDSFKKFVKSHGSYNA